MVVVVMEVGAITLVVVCCLLRRRVDLVAAVPMQKAVQQTIDRTIAIGMEMARKIRTTITPIISPKRLTVYRKMEVMTIFTSTMQMGRCLQLLPEVDPNSSEEVEIGQLSSSDPSEQSLTPLHLSLTKVVH